MGGVCTIWWLPALFQCQGVSVAEFHECVVVGGGQAGLVASHALSERGIGHVVLERDRIAERWRSARWDSLRFQFPNRVLGLPGMPYDRPDPEGFAHHSDVVGWLERYAERTRAPVREHTAVTSLDRDGDRWRLLTDDGELRTDAVVLATGPFQRPRLPAWAGEVPGDVAQIHAASYRGPGQLPDGAVLVVGSGGSGAQIAEELVGAGRETFLCVSRHRRVPRRILDRDVFDWLVEIGLMDRTRADWVDGRMPPTVLVTGVDGGHDVNLRDLEAQGATLLGTLRAVRDGVLDLADDADVILDAGDALYDETVQAILRHAATRGIDPPAMPSQPRPAHRSRPASVSLRRSGIGSIIWATGYSFDYDWLHVPCLTAGGEPVQNRGVTEIDRLYFLGLHWMHTFTSGTFLGIGDDAAYVVSHLVDHARRRLA
jgi:putative flavoprotein involved in K+ transport